VLPGQDFTLDVHSIIFGKTIASRTVPTSFYGYMRNFYFNGHLLFDYMSSHGGTIPPLQTTTTAPPGHVFGGDFWVMYDLNLMPPSYLRRSNRETFELIFQTNEPNGLIWFTGNELNNMYLALKVCILDSNNRWKNTLSKNFDKRQHRMSCRYTGLNCPYRCMQNY